jgi:hypothetical protein
MPPLTKAVFSVARFQKEFQNASQKFFLSSAECTQHPMN